VYRGANLLAIDEKGRVAMPARYRQSLLDSCGGQLVITENFREPCLLLYPAPAWLEFESKLMALPDVDAAAAWFKRQLSGNAVEIEMDKQGRMLLPQVMRDDAGLAREAMLVGRINRFEIWDVATWKREQDAFLAASRAGNLNLPDEFKSLTL
jgi:MraZ protein